MKLNRIKEHERAIRKIYAESLIAGNGDEGMPEHEAVKIAKTESFGIILEVIDGCPSFKRYVEEHDLDVEDWKMIYNR